MFLTMGTTLRLERFVKGLLVVAIILLLLHNQFKVPSATDDDAWENDPVLNDPFIESALKGAPVVIRPPAPKNVTVLLYSAYWGNHKEFHGLRPKDCQYPFDDGFDHGSEWCVISRDRNDTQTAGLLLFHSRDIRPFDLPSQRIANQPWVYFTTESLHNEVAWNSPVMKNDSLFAMMDLSGTYALTSDIPQTYETKTDFVSVLRAPLANLTEKRSLTRAQSPILWIATNCNASSGRHHYIQELMNHIPVDSYGKCLHTKDVPTGFPGRYNSSDLSYLSTLIKEYKFYLAVENSNCPDYVAEKYFIALCAGVLPIVDGPPSGYTGFAPTNRSVIELDDFPNPRDLADYIKKLDADDSLYRSYFDYKDPKNAPFEETFQKKWADPGVEQGRGWCGFCREASRSLHQRSTHATPSITNVSSETRPPLRDSMRPPKCAAPGKFSNLKQEEKKKQ